MYLVYVAFWLVVITVSFYFFSKWVSRLKLLNLIEKNELKIIDLKETIKDNEEYSQMIWNFDDFLVYVEDIKKTKYTNKELLGKIKDIEIRSSHLVDLYKKRIWW